MNVEAVGSRSGRVSRVLDCSVDELWGEGSEVVVERSFADFPFQLSVVAVARGGMSGEEAAESVSYVQFGGEGLVSEGYGEVGWGFDLPPRQLAEEDPEFVGRVVGFGLGDSSLPGLAARSLQFLVNLSVEVTDVGAGRVGVSDLISGGGEVFGVLG